MCPAAAGQPHQARSQRAVPRPSWSREQSAGGGARLAVIAAAAVLVAGIAGEVTHTGVFFVPALVALAGAAISLWRERP